MEDFKEMGYDDPEDILYELFGVDTEEDLEDAIDSWCKD